MSSRRSARATTDVRPVAPVDRGPEVRVPVPAPRYEPVFDLASGAAVGVHVAWWADEASRGTAHLARWTPLASPSLAPLALARLIDQIVLEIATAAVTTDSWWVMLRLGRHQLCDPRVMPWLAAAIDHASLPGKRLVIEAPGRVIDDVVSSGQALPLAARGARFAVADLGVHAVPTSVLRLAPVRFARIDLAAASRHLAAHGGAELDELVAEAARCGVRVIAEGIEDDEQLEPVHHAGIPLVQGYRWGSPGPLTKVVDRWARTA